MNADIKMVQWVSVKHGDVGIEMHAYMKDWLFNFIPETKDTVALWRNGPSRKVLRKEFMHDSNNISIVLDHYSGSDSKGFISLLKENGWSFYTKIGGIQ